MLIWLYKFILGLGGVVAFTIWGLGSWKFWLAFILIAWLIPAKLYDDIIIHIRRD